MGKLPRRSLLKCVGISLLALVSVVVLFMSPSMPAHAQQGSAGEPVLRSQEEAWRRDAGEYVKAYGGTIDEAVRRLKLQSQIAQLDATLQAKEMTTFAGLWIEHTPRFRVVVQLTRGSRNSILPYLQNGSVGSVVEVQRALASLADLQAIHKDVIQKLRTVNIPAESGVNLQSNSIEVYMTNRIQFDAALSKAGIHLPNNAKIITIPALATPQAYWYAGLSLATCTSGFTVVNPSNVRYSTTAGHCDDNAIQPASRTGNPIINGAYDFRIINPPAGSTLKNWASDNINDSTPYYREITGWIARAPVGTFICKYGKFTAYTCGTVEQNNYSYQGSATYLLIKSSDPNSKISCGGDSGAAWFGGSTAYGIHTAGWCSLDSATNKAVSMPIQGLRDWGYSPAISP